MAWIAMIAVLNILFIILPYSPLFFFGFLISLFLIYKLPVKNNYKLLIAGFSLLVIMPLAGMQNTYYLDVITQAGIYVVLAIGLNIVVGFAGLLDLGYIAFYAIGAYLYAILATPQANQFISEAILQFPLSGHWFWLLLIIGMILAAVFGVVLGFPVLRLKGDYLAIVTLGFGEIIRIVLNNLDKPINITNGPKGLSPIEPPMLFGFTLNHPLHFYFIVILLIVAVVISTKRLQYSRIGRAWEAIREDEVAAKSMGINLVKMKLLAFATGASFAGAMGVIFAAKQTFIDPSSFGFMESIVILAMVILGGMGSIAGAAIGAVSVVVLQLQILKELSEGLNHMVSLWGLSFSSHFDPTKYERLIFGLILILMCIYKPKGLLPAKRKGQ